MRYLLGTLWPYRRFRFGTGQSAAVMSQKRHSEALGTGAGGVGDARRWTSWPQSNSPRSRYEGE